MILLAAGDHCSNYPLRQEYWALHDWYSDMTLLLVADIDPLPRKVLGFSIAWSRSAQAEDRSSSLVVLAFRSETPHQLSSRMLYDIRMMT